MKWTLPELTKELYTREAYDDSPSTGGQKKPRAVVETPQKPKSTTADIPPAAEPLALLMHHKKYPKMRRRNPQQNQRKTKKCTESHWTQQRHQEYRPQAAAEKRTETQETMSVKTRMMTKSPTPVSPPDDFAKRRLLKKTDLKSEHVRTPVEIEDTDLLHTVKALINDENGEEAKPKSEESEKTKIST